MKKIKIEIDIDDKGFDFNILNDPILSRIECQNLAICFIIQLSKLHKNVVFSDQENKNIMYQIEEFMKTYEAKELIKWK